MKINVWIDSPNGKYIKRYLSKKKLNYDMWDEIKNNQYNPNETIITCSNSSWEDITDTLDIMKLYYTEDR